MYCETQFKFDVMHIYTIQKILVLYFMFNNELYLNNGYQYEYSKSD